MKNGRIWKLEIKNENLRNIPQAIRSEVDKCSDYWFLIDNVTR